MNKRYTLRAALLASVCSAPFAAVAGDFDVDASPAAVTAATPVYDNEVDVGLRGSRGNTFSFGRYNGQADGSGVTGIGGWVLTNREDPRSGGTRYFSFTGKDIELQNTSNYLPESSVALRVGDQGAWGVKAYYDAITYTQSTKFQTANDSNGNLVNGLAPPANGSWNLRSDLIAPYMNTDTIATRRDIGGLNLKARLDDWTLTSNVQHEHKDGTMEQSVLFGVGGPTYNSSANANAYFPQVVDYDTDKFDIKGGYTKARLQSEIGYSLSRFSDNNTSMKVLDPFGPTAAATGATLGSAIYSLPPSNWSHQIKGAAGYDVTPTTRLNATAVVGMELRDDHALVQGMGTTSTAGATNPAPVNEHAAARTIFANLTAAARPLEKVDLRGSYTYDSRQDMRSLERITYAENDTTGLAASTAYSLPLSWTKQTVKVDAGYRILPSTKVDLDYSFNDMHRQNAQAIHSTENVVGGGVRSDLADGLNGHVGYDHGVRATNLETQGENGALGITENKMAFYEASRTYDSVNADLHYTPTNGVTGGVSATYVHDNYPSMMAGITSDNTITVGPDLDIRFTDSVATHLFYNYERIYQNMEGSTGSATASPESVSETTTNSLHTAGAALDWKPSDRLKIKGTYVFAYGDTAYSYYVSPNFNPNLGAVPDITTVMHNFSLTGEYEVMPGVSVWTGYSFQHLAIADFQNNWGVTSYSNYLLPGDTNPNYNVHTISAMIKTKW